MGFDYDFIDVIPLLSAKNTLKMERNAMKIDFQTYKIATAGTLKSNYTIVEVMRPILFMLFNVFLIHVNISGLYPVFALGH